MYKILSFLIFFAQINIFVSAQDYFFNSYTTSQGLSQNTVYCIAQDSLGFMWFGTQDGGLNKFNGVDFSNFQENNNLSNTLSSNDVSSIVEYEKGILFISTWGKGLNVFNTITNHFDVVSKLDSFNNKPIISDDYIQCLFLDKTKNIWIGTRSGGIVKYNHKTKSSIIYKHKPNKNSLCNNRVWSVCEDNNKNIWIGTSDGLSMLDLITETFLNYNQTSGIIGSTIRAVFCDENNILWIGSEKGLNRFNIKNNTIITHNPYFGNNKTFSVNKIFKDSYGNLWIGTFESGLMLYNDLTDTFTSYKYDPALRSSLTHNDIRDIYEDYSHNLWIATRGGGINKIRLKPDIFKAYKHDPNNKNSLSNNRITGIIETKPKELYITTSISGLNIYNQETNLFSHIQHNPNNESGLSSNTLQGLYKDKYDNVWIGTWNKGVNIYNQKTQSFSYLKSNLTDTNSISNNEISFITADYKENIWIGTKSGLNKYNPKTNNNTRYFNDFNNPNSISSNVINIIYEGKDSNLWIGTQNGLNKYNNIDNSYTRYFKTTEKGSISNNNILSIYQDNKNNLWIGTRSGLNLFQPKTNSFLNYNIGETASENIICSILEDDISNLWISKITGICCFNTTSKTYINYDFNTAERNNDFYEMSNLKTSWGELFFGGSNGIHSFYPNKITPETFRHSTVIEDFVIINKKYNELFPNDSNINYKKSIYLKYKQSTFTVIFASLEYSNPIQHKYRYKLVGFDKDWNYVSNQRTARYTNLSPGHYKLLYNSSNSNGIFNTDSNILEIYIKPPFWKTIWFYALCISITLFLIILFINLRERTLKREKAILEKKVQIRTSHIEQQKEEILSQSEELQKLSIVASETDNPVAILDKETNFEWVNNAFIKKYNFNLEELIELRGKSILTAASNEKTKEKAKLCIKTKKPVSFDSFEYNKQQEKIYIKTTLTPLLNKNNEIKKIIAIDVDITDLIEAQEIIELKNSDIISSIMYAKRIQDSVVSSFESFQKTFPESFLLNLPKDIVSGDFFWFTKIDNKIFIALADCTGHGVPGAFMSIIGVFYLNQILKIKNILEPNQILNRLNQRILETLSHPETNHMSTDGMDIAILCIDLENMSLTYSGANHPLYIGKNDIVTQYSGDRMPIGLYQKNFSFCNKTIPINKNDLLYCSSDGIVDQFGGKFGKKFKSHKFQTLLSHVQNEPVNIQKEKIFQSFTNWKGKNEQVDDILIMGLKI